MNNNNSGNGVKTYKFNMEFSVGNLPQALKAVNESLAPYMSSPQLIAGNLPQHARAGENIEKKITSMESDIKGVTTKDVSAIHTRVNNELKAIRHEKEAILLLEKEALDAGKLVVYNAAEHRIKLEDNENAAIRNKIALEGIVKEQEKFVVLTKGGISHAEQLAAQFHKIPEIVGLSTQTLNKLNADLANNKITAANYMGGEFVPKDNEHRGKALLDAHKAIAVALDTGRVKTEGFKAATDKLNLAQSKLFEQQGKLKKAVVIDKAGLLKLDEMEKKLEALALKLAEAYKIIEKNKGVPVLGDKALEKNANSLGKVAKQAFGVAVVFRLIRRALREAINTVREFDKAITDMTVVTGMSRKEASKLTDTIQETAKATSMAMTDIASLTTAYLRQGRTIAAAEILTRETAKSARISGLTWSNAINYMTAAINGFKLEATDATRVSDVFANIAANAATSYEEIAVAISKVSAQAATANMSLEFTTGILAKMLETTREAPESIGTALKTVIARMRELSDFGKTLEDNTSINKVENALSSVGIKLREANGEFRDMESIFEEVGKGWDNMSKMSQQAIAQAMAGTRQQSRLLAIFQDWDRTAELIEKAGDSAGAAAFQYSQYAKGMEAAFTNLKTSWQTLTQSLVDSDALVYIVDLVQKLLNGIAAFFKSTKGVAPFLAMSAFALFGISKIMKFIVGIQTLSQALQAKKLAAQALENTTLNKRTGILAKIFGQEQAILATKEAQVAANVAGNAHETATAAIAVPAAGSKLMSGVNSTMGLMVAAGLALVAIQRLIKEINYNKIEKIQERILENQNAIYESKHKTSKIGALTKEYEDLSRSLVKTTADMDRMKAIREELITLDEKNYRGLSSDSEIIGMGAIIDAEEEAKRKEARAKSLKEFYKAEKKYGAKAFENPEIMKVFTEAYQETINTKNKAEKISDDTALAYQETMTDHLDKQALADAFIQDKAKKAASDKKERNKKIMGYVGGAAILALGLMGALFTGGATLAVAGLALGAGAAALGENRANAIADDYGEMLELETDEFLVKIAEKEVEVSTRIAKSLNANGIAGAFDAYQEEVRIVDQAAAKPGGTGFAEFAKTLRKSFVLFEAFADETGDTFAKIIEDTKMDQEYIETYAVMMAEMGMGAEDIKEAITRLSEVGIKKEIEELMSQYMDDKTLVDLKRRADMLKEVLFINGSTLTDFENSFKKAKNIYDSIDKIKKSIYDNSFSSEDLIYLASELPEVMSDEFIKSLTENPTKALQIIREAQADASDATADALDEIVKNAITERDFTIDKATDEEKLTDAYKVQLATQNSQIIAMQTLVNNYKNLGKYAFQNLEVMMETKRINAEIDALVTNSERHGENKLKNQEKIIGLIREEGSVAVKALNDMANIDISHETNNMVSSYLELGDIINGKVIPNMRKLEAAGISYQAYMDDFAIPYEKAAEALLTVEKRLFDAEVAYRDLFLSQQDVMVQTYKEKLTSEHKALKESLEDRKTLYQKYYDAIDKEFEADDYENEKQKLEKTIATLSMASDSVSLKKLKEAQKDLDELNKDRAKKVREEERSLVMETLDETIKAEDERFDTTIENNQNLWDSITELTAEQMVDIFTTYNEGFKNATEQSKEALLRTFRESVSALDDVNYDFVDRYNAALAQANAAPPVSNSPVVDETDGSGNVDNSNNNNITNTISLTLYPGMPNNTSLTDEGRAGLAAFLRSLGIESADLGFSYSVNQ